MSGFAIKKGRVKTHQSSHHLISCPLKMLHKEVNHLFHGEHDKVPQEFYSNVSEFKEEQVDKESVLQSDYSFQSWNKSISGYMPTSSKTNECHLLTSDKNFLLPDNCFLEDSFTIRERFSDHMQSHFSSTEWQNESPEIESVAKDESLGSAFSFDHYEFRNRLPFSKSNIKPILQGCSSQRSLSLDRDLFAGKEAFEFLNDGFKNKRRRLCTAENVGIPKGDMRFDIPPCALLQDNASCTQQLPDIDGAEMSADFDLLPGAYVNSSATNGKLIAKGKGLASNSILELEMYASGNHSSMSDWCSVTSSDFIQEKNWDNEHFPDDNASEGSKGWGIKGNCWHLPDSWEIMLKPSSQDNFFSSCTSSVLDFKNSADSSKDIFKFPQWQDQNNEFSLQHSDISVGETDWLLLDPGSKDPKRNDEYERQENQLGYKAHVRDCVDKERSSRSNSTPPFYRPKRRFISLNNHSMRKEEPYTQLFKDWPTSPGAAYGFMLYVLANWF